MLILKLETYKSATSKMGSDTLWAESKILNPDSHKVTFY